MCVESQAGVKIAHLKYGPVQKSQCYKNFNKKKKTQEEKIKIITDLSRIHVRNQIFLITVEHWVYQQDLPSNQIDADDPAKLGTLSKFNGIESDLFTSLSLFGKD